MKSAHSRFAMAMALILAIPATLPAGSVSLDDLVVAQDLAADLAYAYINAAVPDSQSVLTYNSTFDATGASGTFSGTYLGDPITGTLNMTVEGDPIYNASTTTDSDGNFNITLNAIFNPIGNTGVYTVVGTFGAFGALTGTASKSTMGSYSIYTGSLRDANGDYFPFKFLYNNATGDVTSIFGLSDHPYVDNGNIQGNGLPGWLMHLNVGPAPEPSSFVLLGIAAMGGLVVFGRRSRRVSASRS